MSRENSLVSVQWVEDNLDNPKVVVIEVDEDTIGLRQGPHQGRDQARLDHRPAGPGPPRLRQQGPVRGAPVRARRRQRRHRRPLRRQQQLVRGVRVLVLQALRPPGRQADGRRPQEVGAGQPRADRRAAVSRAATSVHGAGARTAPSAPSVTRSSPPSAPRTSSTCAAPTSTPAASWRRPTSRRSSRSAPATSRPRSTSRGARTPTTTAPSSRTRTSPPSTTRSASTRPRTPSPCCRIGERSSLHLVRAAGDPRQEERQELRRLVDRVRLPRRRPDRARRRARLG